MSARWGKEWKMQARESEHRATDMKRKSRIIRQKTATIAHFAGAATMQKATGE